MKFYVFVLLLLLHLSTHAQYFVAKELSDLITDESKPFAFGVASGDPTSNSVQLWTKLLIADTQPQQVQWRIAKDTLLQNIVAEGNADALPENAYSVHVAVEGLEAGTMYFYAFNFEGKSSLIGRTKTAPLQTESLRFAVTSCNNFESGYFNGFRMIANRHDLDAVIHLGDYIYEYGIREYGKSPNVRQHIPPHEILSLEDYRTRYAQYRLDPDLMEAHRLHPFMLIWDDHEVANDSYRDGAGNHQQQEGSWEARKQRARKVYFEWMPVTRSDSFSIIRKLSYGNLVTLFLLDGRLEGRAKQIKEVNDPAIFSESQTMLGKRQTNWLIDGMKNDSAAWRIICNQVIFSEVYWGHVIKKRPRNTDAWDGYPFERNKIFDSLNFYGVKNNIVITGDIHTSWAFDLVNNPRDKNSYNPKTGAGVIGSEFVTPSISSANLNERVSTGIANFAASLVKKKKHNPHLKFINLVDHGYLLLELSEESATGTWHFTKYLTKPTNEFRTSKPFVTLRDKNRLFNP